MTCSRFLFDTESRGSRVDAMTVWSKQGNCTVLLPMGLVLRVNDFAMSPGGAKDDQQTKSGRNVSSGCCKHQNAPAASKYRSMAIVYSTLALAGRFSLHGPPTTLLTMAYRPNSPYGWSEDGSGLRQPRRGVL